MKVSDEVLSIEIDELDKPKEETKTVTVQAEVDPLKEIEANIGESLVLNM
jgi:hypothetical protein